jgi:hypothetical protein
MREDIPVSTDKRCPACGSTDVHEMPANIGTRTLAFQVTHLWSCATWRNAFRLADAACNQHDPHFDS